MCLCANIMSFTLSSQIANPQFLDSPTFWLDITYDLFSGFEVGRNMEAVTLRVFDTLKKDPRAMCWYVSQYFILRILISQKQL